MSKPSPTQARTMSPKKAAAFLRENFSKAEQLAELKAMLAAGGRVSSLAHGIAVELRLIEHEELEEPLVKSLKIKASDLAAGYGAASEKDAGERSPFAGKGPMYARMGNSELEPSSTGDGAPDEGSPDDESDDTKAGQ